MSHEKAENKRTREGMRVSWEVEGSQDKEGRECRRGRRWWEGKEAGQPAPGRLMKMQTSRTGVQPWSSFVTQVRFQLLPELHLYGLAWLFFSLVSSSARKIKLSWLVFFSFQMNYSKSWVGERWGKTRLVLKSFIGESGHFFVCVLAKCFKSMTELHMNFTVFFPHYKFILQVYYVIWCTFFFFLKGFEVRLA